MAAACSVHARFLMLEQRAGQASILDCEHTEGLVEDTIGRFRKQIRTSRALNLFELSPAVDIRRVRWKSGTRVRLFSGIVKCVEDTAYPKTIGSC